MSNDVFANLHIEESEKSSRRKKKRTRFFYKVENHQELFKIGASYLKDFNSGIKSFAIGSTGYHTSQQKTIMGLASFFDHQEDLKIAIVTENLTTGYFAEIVNLEDSHEVHLTDEIMFNVTTFHNHFDFILLEDFLLSEKHAEENEEEQDLIDDFLDSYDIIFWDVPEIHKIQNCPQIYFPILERFETLSLIVAQSLTRKEEVDHIISFFGDYGVTLKGLLMDGKEAEKVEKKGFFKGLFG
jgi:hypothetical protein